MGSIFWCVISSGDNDRCTPIEACLVKQNISFSFIALYIYLLYSSIHLHNSVFITF